MLSSEYARQCDDFVCSVARVGFPCRRRKKYSNGFTRTTGAEFCAAFDAPAPIPANPSRRKCVARAAPTPMCRYAHLESLTSIRTFDNGHLIDRYWLD